nr:helix-turn-helix transcriptional regulator [uncultured Anaerosporobacter sp.]
MNNHYHEDITLLDIANKVHVNSSYLSRSFKEHTGATIIATLNNKKIEKAKELLLNSDLKIYEISEAVGISDTTYFSHFFKKNTGLSPKEFKENNI